MEKGERDKKILPASKEPPKESAPAPKGGRTPQLVRGMKDILPADVPFWNTVQRVVERNARTFRYDRIETPILEETALFTRSIGKETDIIEKEMYTFTDPSGDSLSLRPEGTAGIVRAYIEHGMVNQPQPVRLWYSGPFFRHDRPQAGRYRQLHQFGFEVVGDGHPVIDAQLIQLCSIVFSDLKVPVSIQVNSIGDEKCRPAYEKLLQDYYRPRRNTLCENCKRRFTKSPLRLLDCKEPDCVTLQQDAPQFVDHLDEECRQHFVSVLEYLDELEVPYTLNPRIVRGLDYYTRTTFEVWADTTEGRAMELGGGGRYDRLVELLGDRPTPAVGFACGIERTILKLKELNLVPQTVEGPDVFVAQLGENARKKALKLYTVLREEGFTVADGFSKDGLKSQLETANRVGAKFTLLLGQKEIVDGTILIRDMENGIQEIVDFGKIVPELKKRMKRNGEVAN